MALPLIPILAVAALGALVFASKKLSGSEASKQIAGNDPEAKNDLGKVGAGGASDDELLKKILDPAPATKAAIGSSADPYVAVAPGIYRLTDVGRAALVVTLSTLRGSRVKEVRGGAAYNFSDRPSGAAIVDLLAAPGMVAMVERHALDQFFDAPASLDVYSIPTANVPSFIAGVFGEGEDEEIVVF